MDDKGPMMIAVCWIFTVLAILFVGARLYVRAVVHDRLAADDYIVVFSCVGIPHTLTPPDYPPNVHDALKSRLTDVT